MKNYTLHFFIVAAVAGCKQQTAQHSTKLDTAWLNSIIKNSDSSYTKPYFRTDFVTASYYFTKKDSSLCQVMKDSAGKVRQISIAQKNIRTFYGQYYANGQLQAWLPFDAAGQYHGDAEFYFENGIIQSSGTYTHGFKTGKWTNYNEKGKAVSADEFDNSGQFIKSVKP